MSGKRRSSAESSPHGAVPETLAAQRSGNTHPVSPAPDIGTATSATPHFMLDSGSGEIGLCRDEN